MSPDKMTIGKTYKIQRNNKYQKVIVKSINDSTAVVSKRGEEENIPLAEITKVKSRKFSIVKTIVLPMTVAAAVTGLMILSYDGPTLGTIGWSKL